MDGWMDGYGHGWMNVTAEYTNNANGQNSRIDALLCFNNNETYVHICS